MNDACTCGSGAHPRRCREHPDRYELHCAEMSRDNAQDACDELEKQLAAANRRVAELEEQLGFARLHNNGLVELAESHRRTIALWMRMVERRDAWARLWKALAKRLWLRYRSLAKTSATYAGIIGETERSRQDMQSRLAQAEANYLAVAEACGVFYAADDCAEQRGRDMELARIVALVRERARGSLRCSAEDALENLADELERG